jgi:transaldolase
MGKLTDLQKFGQSLWYDNISRDLLQNGEIQRLVDEGVTGMTSNPAIFEKAISGSSAYDDQLRELALEGKTAQEIFEALAVEDIRAAAAILRPVYDRTNGADGYVSLEVSPLLAHDTAATAAEAARLAKWVDRPNVMIKIPATKAGVPAIQESLAAGLNINITLIFSREAYAEVIEAYLTALEQRKAAGKPVTGIASVASFFVSRVDTLVDKMLDEKIAATSDENEKMKLKALQGKAANANARLAYQLFKQKFSGARWDALASGGARVQRPLWASTSTKNPDYRDVIYIEELIGPDTVNTAPHQTIDAFRDHGVAAATLDTEIAESRAIEMALHDAGIDMNAVTDKLLEDAVRLFADPFQKLLDAIEVKRKSFVGEPAR